MPRVATPHEQGTPAFEYSWITPHIAIGTNQCCTTHFRTSLLARGVRADISLEAERIDAPYGVRYFLWLPTRDHAAPTVAQLEVGAATLDRLVRARVKTYVHCRNGHGRAPTLVAAYLILAEQLRPDVAIAFLKSKRPSVHLEPSQQRMLERVANRR